MEDQDSRTSATPASSTQLSSPSSTPLPSPPSCNCRPIPHNARRKNSGASSAKSRRSTQAPDKPASSRPLIWSETSTKCSRKYLHCDSVQVGPARRLPLVFEIPDRRHAGVRDREAAEGPEGGKLEEAEADSDIRGVRRSGSNGSGVPELQPQIDNPRTLLRLQHRTPRG